MSSSELIIGQNQKLFEWWDSFKPKLPRRQDFDILEHYKIAANIFLVEFIGASSFQYRICGEEVMNLIGENNTGKIFNLFDDPRDPLKKQINELIVYYQQIKAERVSKSCRGALPVRNKLARPFESVDCPLMDENGEVTHIVGAISSIK